MLQQEENPRRPIPRNGPKKFQEMVPKICILYILGMYGFPKKEKYTLLLKKKNVKYT